MTVTPWSQAPGAEPAAAAEIPTQLALESAQVGVWEWDFGSGQLRVDARWCESLQLDPCPGAEHLTGWARQIHPDDATEFLRKAEAVKGGVERFEAEYRMLRRDARWVWVLQRGRIIARTPEGQALRVCGVCIEVDDRKLTQMAQAESGSRLATALWGARAAFWQWQVSAADVTVQSPLWFAMTGYTRQEWESLPQPWFARIHPQDRAYVERHINDHVKGLSASIEVEYRIRTAAGDWKWMLTRGRAVEWDFDGNGTCAVGVSLDVDAQKRTERALRRVERGLDAARAALWEWDLATNEVSRSGFYHRMLPSAAAAEPPASPFAPEHVHPADLPAAQARLQEAVTGREDLYEAQYRVRHADGRWRWVLDRGRVCERDQGGRAVRMIGLLMDITGRAPAAAVLDSHWRAVTAIAPGFSVDYALTSAGELTPRPLGEEARRLLGAPAAPDLSLEDLLEEGQKGPWAALLAQARAGGSASGELRVRTASGVKRLQVGVAPVPDPFSQEITGVIATAHDVTSHTQAHSLLKESEAHLRALAQGSPDWLILLDADLTVLFINRALGHYAPEDFIGRPLLSLAPPAHRGTLAQRLTGARASGEPATFDMWMTRLDGTQACYEHRLVPLSEAGCVRHLCLVIADVTALRQELAQLHERHTQLTTVMAESSDWLALFDRELRCRFLSRPLRGLPPERWLGAPVEDFATPPERTRVRGLFEGLLRTGAPLDFELLVRGGPPGHARVRARAIEGGQAGVVVNMTLIQGGPGRLDLPAQEQILQAVGDAVVAWDLAEHRIRHVNRAFERLLGVPAGTLHAQPLEPLLRLSPAQRQTLEAALGEGAPPAALEIECLRADGSAVRVAGVVSRLPGHPSHGLLVVSDSQEHRRTAGQALQIATREQARIGRDMDEELGQGLTSIALRLRGAATQLRREGSPVRMDVEDAIEQVNQAIQSVHALARGLPPAGGLPVLIGQLAARVSERTGVQVSVQVDLPGTPPLNPCVAGQLYRIVQEALSNVVRHSRASLAVITLRAGAGTLTLGIEDNGRGLPPGALEGAAPGLSMMRYRAQALGGLLSIESGGGGTHVRLSCPFEPPPLTCS